MQKISGFGGFFFQVCDPEALGCWYEEQFGINSMGGNEVCCHPNFARNFRGSNSPRFSCSMRYDRSSYQPSGGGG